MILIGQNTSAPQSAFSKEALKIFMRPLMSSKISVQAVPGLYVPVNLVINFTF